MLMGEHAVLQQQFAIALPVPYHITVTLTPRPDHRVIVHSTIGSLDTTLTQIKIDNALSFVSAAIIAFLPDLTQGFELKIDSNFSSKIGFGSSAAVLAATTKALNKSLHLDLSLEQLFDRAKLALLQVQGRGSGTDLAVSLWQQPLAFRASPFAVLPLKHTPPIVAVYCGYKVPTPQVLEKIASTTNKAPELYQRLYQQMGLTTESAIEAVNQADWLTLAALMQQYQQYLDQLGVNDATLQAIINTLLTQPDILAAKISGSGLGDCVIGLGTTTENELFSTIATGVQRVL